VQFHLFKYAPVAALNVFGYASALEADVRLRPRALAATPLALAAGCRALRAVANHVDATIVHGHWVIPGGAMAALAAPSRPLVVSLHGSDVFVAERHAAAGLVARRTFGRAAYVTACSDDLRDRARALGAPDDRSITIPYGVDAARFRPDAAARRAVRTRLGLQPDDQVVFAAGRFVRKKGFEYLIEAIGRLAPHRPGLHLILAGGGDLEAELRNRVRAAGLSQRAHFPGVVRQGEVADLLASADVAVVPSVRDDAGNVDGLPNVVLEALASGTPVIASPAGGIASVVRDGITGLLVAQRDVGGLAAAITQLLDHPETAAALSSAGRAWVLEEGSWGRVAAAFERVYEAACPAPTAVFR
jgi:glycosyltransferase involved in cell wall biosynthesis